ncbi:F-box only protein 9 [Condylostylus longicornis]|uniref:F-box only protein 9 n=1 Tax=Condylostylus longicornis TaxID=2530218 RepID=UPI00244DEEB3|nr:F-box only protein 9 [Condylostylus longicornis]
MLTSSLESEEEEDESSSITPLDSMPNQLQNALEEFREKWQKELKTPSQPRSECVTEKTSENTTPERSFVPNSNQFTTEETKALNFFTQAVDLEKRGKVYDALIFYRKAVQIDPKIEFKFYETTIKAQTNQPKIESTSNKTESHNKDHNISKEEDLTDVDLYKRFQNDLIKNQYFIKRSNADMGVIATTKHLNDLPMEIIYNILRWVVSSQLDIRSLEQVATVCKGLYLCARDNEMWRLICLKVWGVNTGSLSNSPYCSWREMYIERKRVHFHGCYISKTTYLRYGENSFQDQFYRPVQLIEYYRYFRFLPDGNVLMWTTAEEPAQAVSKLKNINQLRPEILRGHYRFHGDIVIIMMKRNVKQNPSIISKRRGNFCNDLEGSYSYYIEFKIINKTKRRFCQLQWNNYSIVQTKNKREITTDFDVTSSKYPPLWFSRVKSYHLEAEIPLQ